MKTHTYNQAKACLIAHIRRTQTGKADLNRVFNEAEFRDALQTAGIEVSSSKLSQLLNQLEVMPGVTLTPITGLAARSSNETQYGLIHSYW